jgi:hypothetical protein
MLTDKWIFSNAQTSTASTVENSTNVIDTENTDSNLGAGTALWLVCRVNTLFAGTSGTFVVKLQHCATSGGTYLDLLVSPSYTTTQLVKGFDLLTVPLPVENMRYLKLTYTQATGSGYTAGKIDAYLAPSAPRNTGAWGT